MSPSVPWKPRLVALDVDGTLFDPITQSLSLGVRDAVRRVVEAGSYVVIATGRTMIGTQPVLDELGLRSGFALCSNGAVLLDVSTGETLAVETFDPAPVQAVLAAHLPGAVYAVERLGKGSLVTSEFDEELLRGPQKVTTVDDLVRRPVPRLIANWVGRSPADVLDALRGVALPSCTATIDHYEPWVTVVPGGVTKGSALEKLRAQLGIPHEETLAAGDGDNDVQMLAWAAHSIAMGQAPDTVKAVADEITGPVDDDGLAAALDRWFR